MRRVWDERTMGFSGSINRLAAAKSETYLSYVIERITQTALSFLFLEVGENAQSDFRCYQHHEAEVNADMAEVSQLC